MDNRPDGISSRLGNMLHIDFSQLPIEKLVDMRRLGDGMRAYSCDSWAEASTAVVRGLNEYLDDNVARDATCVGFTIRIRVVDEREFAMARHQIGLFFKREDIHITSVA